MTHPILRYLKREITLHAVVTWHCRSQWNRWYAMAYNVARPKLILNSNFAKTRSFITSVPDVQSIRGFAQSTVLVLLCSAQNFKTIGLFKGILCAKKFFARFEFKVSFGRILYIAQHGRFTVVGSIFICRLVYFRIQTPTARTTQLYTYYAKRNSTTLWTFWWRRL